MGPPVKKKKGPVKKVGAGLKKKKAEPKLDRETRFFNNYSENPHL